MTSFLRVFLGLFIMTTSFAASDNVQDSLPAFIYKALTPAEWKSFQENGKFEGTALDKKDGYIHISMIHQLDRILKKFMKDEPLVIIVKLKTSVLKDKLVLEYSKSRTDKYPHYYGALPREAIAAVEKRPNA